MLNRQRVQSTVATGVTFEKSRQEQVGFFQLFVKKSK